MLLLRIVFFILEATATSYGLLAIHEVVAMLFGSMMLIKTDVEFLQNERRLITVAHPPRSQQTLHEYCGRGGSAPFVESPRRGHIPFATVRRGKPRFAAQRARLGGFVTTSRESCGLRRFGHFG